MYILSSSTRLYVACEQALWGTLVVGRGGGGGGLRRACLQARLYVLFRDMNE